jgi:hypothetical protein
MRVRGPRRRALRWGAGGALLLLAFWALVPVVAFDDPLSTVVLDRDGELLGASIVERRIDVGSKAKPVLVVRNTGTSVLYPRLILSGLPPVGRETAAGSGRADRCGSPSRRPPPA